MAADADVSAERARDDRARRPDADDAPEPSVSPATVCFLFSALGEAWPLVAPSMTAAHGVSFLPQSVATSPLGAGKDRSVRASHAGVDASGGGRLEVCGVNYTS